VACGYSHTAVLTHSGEVWSWYVGRYQVAGAVVVVVDVVVDVVVVVVVIVVIVRILVANHTSTNESEFIFALQTLTYLSVVRNLCIPHRGSNKGGGCGHHVGR
jgi:alpha-tubulin suppressor-like RCC1 family protein